jgi:hypothetical protein
VIFPLSKDVQTSKEDILASAWTPVTNGDRKAHLFLSREMVELFNLGAYAGGLYCVSNRALWPRPDYLPVMEFHPASAPRLEFKDNLLMVGVGGSVETRLPRDPLGPSTNTLMDRREITMKGSFNNDSKSLSLQLDPISEFEMKRGSEPVGGASRIPEDFSKEDNDFLKRILNLSVLSGDESRTRAWSYQDFINSGLRNDSVGLESVEWATDGIHFAVY